MYLARVSSAGETRFVIRHSFLENGVWCSRDLDELGVDPGRFIVYPGGNAFYPEPELVDRIDHRLRYLGIRTTDVSNMLEELLWAFIRPDARRAVAGFYRRTSSRCTTSVAQLRKKVQALPIFDRRRFLYLRCGQMDQTRIYQTPPKFFKPLLNKSRDEIEQMLICQEADLRDFERKTYVYVIFDLQQFFQSPMAKKYPQVLPPEKVDRCFMEQLCGLHRNVDMWRGLPVTEVLQPYLRRYAIMYFDATYAHEDFTERFVRDFRRRHRHFKIIQPAVKIRSSEYLNFFGHTRRELLVMDKYRLRALYRKSAIRHHPDQGGVDQRFIRLTQIYQDLIKHQR